MKLTKWIKEKVLARRPRRRRPARLRFEDRFAANLVVKPLESRLLLNATSVLLDGSGNLTITDNDPGGHADQLTVSQNGSNLRLTDNANNLSFNGGPAQATVDIPLASITGNIQINANGGNDSITFNVTPGSLANNIIINAGAGNDTITFTTLGGASTGNLTINGDVGTDTIHLNADITFAAGKSLNATAETINVGAGADLIGSGAATFTLTADNISIVGTLNTGASGSVVLKQQTAARGITLGTEVGSTLSLTNAELSQITTGSLTIGDAANTGSISITANITQAGKNITLVTGGNGSITNTGAGGTLSAGALTLAAGSGGIGTSGSPIRLNATSLSTTSNNSDQFLANVSSPATSLSITSLNAGTQTIRLDSGTFTLSANNIVNNSTSLNINGATFNLSTFNETVSGVTLTSGIIAGTGTLTSSSTFQVFSGSISPILAGASAAIGLNKDGTGTVTLSGANTYTGVTVIDRGTLLVNGSLANGAATVDVDVTNQATLGGTGVIYGSVKVAGGGSVLAPGVSPGVLTVDSLQTGGGSSFDVEIGGTTPGSGAGKHDQLVVTSSAAGAVTIGNGTDLDLSAFDNGSGPLFVPSAGQSFVIIKNEGTSAVVGSFSSLPEGATITNFLGSGLTARITYQGGGGDNNDVVIIVQAPRTLSAAISGGSLTVTDIDAIGKNNDLTVVRSGTSLIITDANEQFTDDSATNTGGTLSNGNKTLTIPNFTTAVTVAMTINMAGGNDAVKLDLSLGDVIPPSGTTVTDASGADTLTLIGATTTVTHAFTNATDGSVTIAGLGVVNYTGQEQIADNLAADTRNFNFSGSTETIVLSNAPGPSNMAIDSSAGTAVTFANPTTLVNVSGGAGDDTIQVQGIHPAYSGSLTIAGDADTDIVNFQSSPTNLGGVAGGTLTVNSSVETTNVNQSVTAGTVLLNSTSVNVNAAVNAGTVAITTNAIEIAAVITAGTITLQPDDDADTVGLGTGAGTFSLTETELTNLSSTGTVTIGRSTGIGAISIADAVNANIDLSLEAFNLTIRGGPTTFASQLTLPSDKTLTILTQSVASTTGTDVAIGGQGLVQVVTSTGGVGSAANPLTVSVAELRVDTSAANANQFLAAVGTVGLQITNALHAGAGTIELVSGTFILGADEILPDGAGKGNLIIDAGATLDLASFSETINGLFGAGTIVKSAGLGDATLTVGGNDANGNFSGVIEDTSGKLALTKFGVGTQILSGANTYSGNTTISAGAIQLGADEAIPDGAGRGNLKVEANATFDLASFSETVNGLLGAGTVVKSVGGGEATLTVGSGDANGNFSGVITDTAGALVLIKFGAGTQILSGANTYSGNTRITSGTIQLGADEVIPDGAGKGNLTIEALGTLDLASFSETVNGLFGAGTIVKSAGAGTETFTVGENNANGNFSGVIKDTAGKLALTKVGAGTLTLSGANTYSGDTTVSEGTLKLGVDELAIPDGANKGNLIVQLGATLDLASFSETVNGLFGAGTIVKSAGLGDAALTVGGNDANGNFSGVITDTSGKLALVKFGVGTQILAGANTYSGNTTISSGTIQLGASNAIPDGAGKGNLAIASSGTFDTAGFNETINGLTGLGTVEKSAGLGSATLQVGNNDATSTFSGVIKNSSGTLNLEKIGGGTLTLAGANTYTGTTLVSAGTLLVTGSLADGASATDVTVAGGATLGGSGDGITTGRIFGTVFIDGGDLAPGPGTAKFATGSIKFSGSAARFLAQLNGITPGSFHDQLIVYGTVALDGATLDQATLDASTVMLSDLTATGIVLIDNDGSADPVSGTFAGIPEGGEVTVNGFKLHLTYKGGDGNDVVLGADTSVLLVNGGTTLEITDITSVTDDALTIKYNSVTDQFEISDPGRILVTNAGSGNGSSLITIDRGSITSIVVKTLDGTDSLTLESTSPFTAVTHNYDNASGGNVVLAGAIYNQTIFYTQLEQLTDTLAAQDREFTFNGNNTKTIVLDDATGLNNNVISSNSSVTTTFINPTTSLTLNSGSGNDSVTVNTLDPALAIASMAVNGGGGVNTLTVATIDVHVGASTLIDQINVTNNEISITIEGDARPKIIHSGFSGAGDAVNIKSFGGDDEIFVQLGGALFPANLSIDAGNPQSADQVTIRGSATAAEHLTLLGTTITTGANTILLTDVETLDIEADALTVDFAGGNPIPINDLTFVGQGASNQLFLKNGTFQTVTHTAASGTNGQIDFLNGGTTKLHYQNLTLATHDDLTVNHRIFNLTSAADDVRLLNVGLPNNGRSQFINGSGSTFVNVEFRDALQTTTVNAGDGSDQISLETMDAGYQAKTILNGQGGDDTFRIVDAASAIGVNYVKFQVEVHGGGHPGDNLLIDDTTDAVGDVFSISEVTISEGLFGLGGKLTYSGLADLEVIASSGDDQISLMDDASVSGNPLANPQRSFVLRTGGGDDQVQIISLDAGYHAETTIRTGQDGSDSIDVAAALTLGSSVSTGSLFLEADSIAVHSPIDTSSLNTFSVGVGDVTFAASQLLVLDEAADIVSRGVVEQVGSTAIIQTAAEITTTGDRIEFDGQVRLTAEVTLDTGANVAGDIIARQSIDSLGVAPFDPPFDLILNAGLGDIQVGGAVGALNRLGNLTVATAHDVAFLGTLRTAGNVVQTVGTGTTSFNGTSGVGIEGLFQIATNNVVFSTADIKTVGNASVTAQNEIRFNAQAGLNAGDSTITLLANQDGIGSEQFFQNSSAVVQTTNPSSDAIRIAVGGTGSALISVIKAGVVSTGTIAITVGGAIADNRNGESPIADANLIAHTVVLKAQTGIGSLATTGGDLDTTVSFLTAGTTGGDINIDETNNIVLRNLLAPAGSVFVNSHFGAISIEKSPDNSAGNQPFLQSATGQVSNAPPLLRIDEVNPNDVITPGDPTQEVTGTIGGDPALGDNIELGENFTIVVKWQDDVVSKLNLLDEGEATGLRAGDKLTWLIAADGSYTYTRTPGTGSGPIEVFIQRTYPLDFLQTLSSTEVVATFVVQNDPRIVLSDTTLQSINNQLNQTAPLDIPTTLSDQDFQPPPIIVVEQPKPPVTEARPLVFVETIVTLPAQFNRLEDLVRGREGGQEDVATLYLVHVGADKQEGEKTQLPLSDLHGMARLLERLKNAQIPNGLYRIYYQEPGLPPQQVMEFQKTGNQIGDPIREPGRGANPAQTDAPAGQTQTQTQTPATTTNPMVSLPVAPATELAQLEQALALAASHSFTRAARLLRSPPP